MAQEIIAVGAVANDGNGDDLRPAYIKINNNFTELYNLIRSEGNVAVTAGANVITFSSPLASSAYSLQVFDFAGTVGFSITAQDANGFTLNCLAAGAINYIAILNN